MGIHAVGARVLGGSRLGLGTPRSTEVIVINIDHVLLLRIFANYGQKIIGTVNGRKLETTIQ